MRHILKAQSTAEYAIVVGLVLAVSLGVARVALKGGMRDKNRQAAYFLKEAGVSERLNDIYQEAAPESFNSNSEEIKIYTQSARTTVVDDASYIDASVLYKGGAQKTLQRQNSVSGALEVELRNKLDISDFK